MSAMIVPIAVTKLVTDYAVPVDAHHAQEEILRKNARLGAVEVPVSSPARGRRPLVNAMPPRNPAPAVLRREL
ncbi:hypothetical protein [Amycolatopsis sp. WGS_07]|uniref:hypothetical protein n=1 Tax=Amycolatopsis sp. WGS_07 TaxID=3076764 RepID=UPI003872E712